MNVQGDGAKWIWEQAAKRLPKGNAHWCVDVYHVSQHLHQCGRELLGEGKPARAWADARLLIVNGDDIGMCHAANVGTVEGLKNGTLRVRQRPGPKNALGGYDRTAARESAARLRQPMSMTNVETRIRAPSAVAMPVTHPSRIGVLAASPILSSSRTCSSSARAGSFMSCAASASAWGSGMPLA